MARLNPSMAVALAALVAAAAGSATAVTTRLLTGADIRNSSLTGADIRNASIRGLDVRDGSIGARDLGTSARNVIGTRGPQGPPGPPGAGTGGSIAAPTPLAIIDGETQSIPSGTTTRIVWNEAGTTSNGADPDEMHDDAVNPDRITPSTPGFYTVHVSVVWPANAVDQRELRIRRNLAGGGLQSFPVAREAADASAIAQNGSLLVRIEQGDSVSAEVRQTSGAALSLNPIQISVAFTAPLR